MGEVSASLTQSSGRKEWVVEEEKEKVRDEEDEKKRKKGIKKHRIPRGMNTTFTQGNYNRPK